MTRHFMRDTPLYQMEQMMMTPPYFKPRGHSLRRSGFRYQAKDVDCEYCMNYSRRNLCPLDQCICLEERIETGALSLEELLRDCLNSKPKMSLWRRLAQLLYQQSLQFFRTDEHRRRWMHWRTRYAWGEQGQGEPRWLDKWQAVLELEDCHRLDYALDLAQNLHCYHFMPRDMELTDFGKTLAKQDGVYPKDELLASCFDAESYANQRMKNMGLSAAEHGFVSWNGTELVYEYSQPDVEPTMSM